MHGHGQHQALGHSNDENDDAQNNELDDLHDVHVRRENFVAARLGSKKCAQSDQQQNHRACTYIV